jgi:hypothetical protein
MRREASINGPDASMSFGELVRFVLDECRGQFGGEAKRLDEECNHRRDVSHWRTVTWEDELAARKSGDPPRACFVSSTTACNASSTLKTFKTVYEQGSYHLHKISIAEKEMARGTTMAIATVHPFEAKPFVVSQKSCEPLTTKMLSKLRDSVRGARTEKQTIARILRSTPNDGSLWQIVFFWASSVLAGPQVEPVSISRAS